MSLTRRDLLRGAGSSVLLGSLGCSIFGGGGGPDLIQRQENPYNAEPRLDRLVDSWITPTDYFYVRSHGSVPEIDSAAWLLNVEGKVERTLQLSLADLDRYPRVTVPATLECAGNRRSEHSRIKTVGGVQWDAGAIGTAEWRGVPLSDILGRAGVQSAARHVWFEGRDVVPLKDRQTVFGGSVPLEKAMQPGTIVALEMNGRPLSRDHGYPARTVVPGYVGARSVKWLGRIVVSDKPSDNNFLARDYRLFPPEATPETVKPEEHPAMFEYPINSAICRPLAGQSVRAGRLALSGYAIAPGIPGVSLARVEVSADGGSTWTEAALTGKEAPFAWRLWTANVEVAAGPRMLAVRAVDSKGAGQPERAPWNFKGYLYNGWHRVPVTVT